MGEGVACGVLPGGDGAGFAGHAQRGCEVVLQKSTPPQTYSVQSQV